ncbi:(2Fe-2S)-binding protein [Leptospira sp. WS92.C1]
MKPRFRRSKKDPESHKSNESNGKILNPDGIVFATGTTPNLQLEKTAGLHCNQGLVVDPYLRTNDPDIYAIGEVAEHSSGLYGTTGATEDQAKVAAHHIYGYAFDFYKGSVHTNLLKIPKPDLVSLRLADTPMDLSEDNFGKYEEIVFLDRKKRKYKKCIIKADKLVGVILIGDKSDLIEFKNLISSGIELGDTREQLLSGDSSAKKPVLGKLICACNEVGEENLCEEIRNGIKTLEELGKTTEAGTGCGSCRPEVSKILKSNLAMSKQEFAFSRV